jgi:hypothetical protein
VSDGAAADLRPEGQRRLRPPSWTVFAGLVVAAAVAYVVFALVRSVPVATVVAVPSSGAFAGPPPALAWPVQGGAAAGVEGVGARDADTRTS